MCPNSRVFRQFSLVKSSQITTVSINWPEETLKAENLAILCFFFYRKIGPTNFLDNYISPK